MINTISRFLATPSPVFELQAGDISVQQYAVIRLAQCVESKPKAQTSQVAISTLYALLNEISRYSGEDTGEVGHHAITGAPSAEQLTDKQKQQVCINALSAIVGVAVYMKDESVRSMNLRRRRGLLGCFANSMYDMAIDHGPGFIYATT